MGYTKAIPPFRGRSRGRVGGCAPTTEMTCGFLIRLVFCQKKKLCGLLVLNQSKRRVHPLLKKSPGSAPAIYITVTSSTINFAPIQVYKTTRVIGWHRPNAKNGCWIKVLLSELKLTRLQPCSLEQSSKDHIISIKSSQANLNVNKRILIQQLFLHWFQGLPQAQRKLSIIDCNTNNRHSSVSGVTINISYNLDPTLRTLVTQYPVRKIIDFYGLIRFYCLKNSSEIMDMNELIHSNNSIFLPVELTFVC